MRRARVIKQTFEMFWNRSGCYGQVIPLSINGPYLVDFAFICVKEIASVGNLSGVAQIDGALGPARLAHSLSVFRNVLNDVDAVPNLVGDPGYPVWHQPPASF